jgi:hypothetical protein
VHGPHPDVLCALSDQSRYPIPPSQGLKSVDNRVAFTIQFLTADLQPLEIRSWTTPAAVSDPAYFCLRFSLSVIARYLG